MTSRAGFSPIENVPMRIASLPYGAIALSKQEALDAAWKSSM